MKKIYIKPEVTCIKISTESIIALSTDDANQITNDNKGDFEMQGREDRPSTPSIWDQGW